MTSIWEFDLNKFILRAAIFAVSILTVAQAATGQNPVSFTVSVSPANIAAGGKGTARVSATIEGGWKMYSITQGSGGPIPTRISLGEGVFTIGAVSGSKPKVAMDPNFGINTETYSGGASFNVAFTANADAPDGQQTLNINVRYQVCNDTVCLPPKTARLTAAVMIGAGAANSPTPTPTPSDKAGANANVKPDNTNAGSAVIGNINSDIAANTNANSSAGTASSVRNASTPQQPGGSASEQSIWGFIWLAMGFGALSLLTPCVFPMIPITVSYFTKQESGSHLRSVRDALIYAGGIILTFTGLGVALAVVFGAAGLNRFAANPYINILITAIFMAFAFSLLGAYNIGVPSSILTKLDKISRSKESGKIAGLLLMGLTFSLTSFTCTAPLVGTILVAAANGELFYPVVGMLAFSSVFALPFFVLALAPRLMGSLPRSGTWMNSVKVVMGFLEIGAALKFVSNVDLVWGWGIFTREVVIAGWIALSILIVLYLLGVFRFEHDSDNSRLGPVRVLNAFLFTTLAFYLLTGLFGSRLGEIESFLPPAKEGAVTRSGGVQANGELTWITNDLQAALAQATAENKKIFVDFTGYTCTNCRWMEANMFPKAKVKAELDKFVRVRLYTDGEGEPYEGFQKMQEQRFGTVALPLYAILSPKDEILSTFAGLTRDENEFIAFLQK